MYFLVLSGGKDYFSVILENGKPVVNVKPSTSLTPLGQHNLADGQWHHLAISMPHKSCKVKDLQLFIDGDIVNTNVINDLNIFQITSGRLSIGGYGYSSPGFEDVYPGIDPYVRTIDDFVLFARPLNFNIDFFTSHI